MQVQNGYCMQAAMLHMKQIDSEFNGSTIGQQGSVGSLAASLRL